MRLFTPFLVSIAAACLMTSAAAQGINIGPAAQKQAAEAEKAREVPQATMETMQNYALGGITLGMSKDEAIAAADAQNFKVKQDFSYAHGTRIVFEHREHRYAIGLEATTDAKSGDNVAFISYRNRLDAPSAEDPSPAGANAWAMNEEMPRLEAELKKELGVSGGNLCIITLNQQGVRCKGEATEGDVKVVLTVISQATGHISKELKLEDLSQPEPNNRQAPRSR